MSSVGARSGLAYSLNKREASDSNWSVGWDKHDSNWSVAHTNKHIYIPTPEIYIYRYDNAYATLGILYDPARPLVALVMKYSQ